MTKLLLFLKRVKDAIFPKTERPRRTIHHQTLIELLLVSAFLVSFGLSILIMQYFGVFLILWGGLLGSYLLYSLAVYVAKHKGIVEK